VFCERGYSSNSEGKVKEGRSEGVEGRTRKRLNVKSQVEWHRDSPLNSDCYGGFRGNKGRVSLEGVSQAKRT